MAPAQPDWAATRAIVQATIVAALRDFVAASPEDRSMRVEADGHVIVAHDGRTWRWWVDPEANREPRHTRPARPPGRWRSGSATIHRTRTAWPNACGTRCRRTRTRRASSARARTIRPAAPSRSSARSWGARRPGSRRRPGPAFRRRVRECQSRCGASPGLATRDPRRTGTASPDSRLLPGGDSPIWHASGLRVTASGRGSQRPRGGTMRRPNSGLCVPARCRHGARRRPLLRRPGRAGTGRPSRSVRRSSPSSP